MAVAALCDSSIDEASISFGSQRRRWTVTELALLTQEGCWQSHYSSNRGRNHTEDGSMPLTGSEDIAMIPPDELVRMTRPLRSSSLFRPIDSCAADHAVPEDQLNQEDAFGTVGLTGGKKIGMQLDVRVWEVIQKEVMDWYEPSQPQPRGCRQVRIPPKDPFQLAPLSCMDDCNRMQGCTTMIAVQLLATCFTLPPEPESCSLPAAFYRDRTYTKGHSSETRLISSLRLHTHFRDFPAFGHSARNSSFALAWPDLCSEPFREERLAEEISRQRGLQQLENSQGCGTSHSSRRSWNEGLFKKVKDSCRDVAVPNLRRRRHDSSDDTTTPHFQRRKIDRIFGRPKRFGIEAAVPVHATPGTSGTQPTWLNSRFSMGRSRVRYHDSLDHTHRWSLQPVLRSEDHPVYIQPVKDHVVRHWRTFRARARSRPSTVNPAQLDSRRSRRQNSNRTSEISSADSSLTRSSTGTESSITNSGPLRLTVSSPEILQPTHTAFPGSDFDTSPSFSPLGLSTANLAVPNTNPHPSSSLANDLIETLGDDVAPSYFPPVATAFQTPPYTEHTAVETFARASRVYTTLFSPPVIAQASPDSERILSDGAGSSNSSSPSSEAKQLHFL